MSQPELDWNAVWKKIHAGRQARVRDPDFWDKRAPEFAGHAKKSDYVDQFMTIMKPSPEWRVLDIGSAAGTLAVPMASLVRSVTALDPSAGMRTLLEERCRQEKIDNIRIVNGRWEDDWDALEIGIHDVAIASRSLLVDDLQGAIEKLQRHAARRVYISTLVGDGPHDRRIIDAVGRKMMPGADYIVVVNLLHQMKIFPNLTFTCSIDQKSFRGVEDALNSMRWMIHEMTREEEEKLRSYLTRTLIRVNGTWQLPYRRVVRWAVLWWEKDCEETP